MVLEVLHEWGWARVLSNAAETSSVGGNFSRRRDWWATRLGPGIVLIGCALFAGGDSLKWLAVLSPASGIPARLSADLSADYLRYGTRLLFWVALFSVALKTLGYGTSYFIPGFSLSTCLGSDLCIGQWDAGKRVRLSTTTHPFVDASFFSCSLECHRIYHTSSMRRSVRVLRQDRGPCSQRHPPLHADYRAASSRHRAGRHRLNRHFCRSFLDEPQVGLDPRLPATLGAGGTVCGVSAAIAVAGAVRARRDVLLSPYGGHRLGDRHDLRFCRSRRDSATFRPRRWRIGSARRNLPTTGFAAAQSYATLPGDVPGVKRDGERPFLRLHLDEGYWSATFLDRRLGLRSCRHFGH